MSQTAEGGHPHTPACSPHPELDEVNIMAAFSQKGVGTFTFLSPVSSNVRMSKVPKPNLNKHIQDHTNTFDLQNFVHDVKNILQVTISERFTKGKCFLERINFWQQIQGKFGLSTFVWIFNCVTSRVWGKWEESTQAGQLSFQSDSYWWKERHPAVLRPVLQQSYLVSFAEVGKMTKGRNLNTCTWWHPVRQ